MTLTYTCLGQAAPVETWAKTAGLVAAKTWRVADVVIGSPTALAQLGPVPGQIRIVALAAVSESDEDLLHKLRFDGTVALDTSVAALLPSITMDGLISADSADHVIDKIRLKPRLAIGTAVRFDRRAELWGDTHFARDLGAALRRLGWRTEVLIHGRASELTENDADAFVYVHGLRPAPVVPLPTGIWVISHPDTFTNDPTSGRSDTQLFSASQRHVTGLGATLLHQATNVARFSPQPRESDLAYEALFVGNSRRQKRAVVTYAMETNVDIAVFGRKWRRLYPQLQVAGSDIPNDALARYYSSAKVVLNDHWPAMVEHGIVSNRIFDALACGAAVLSDHVETIPGLFGDLVTTFSDAQEFADRHRSLLAMAPDDRKRRARQGTDLIRDAHTFDHRAATIDHAMRALLH